MAQDKLPEAIHGREIASSLGPVLSEAEWACPERSRMGSSQRRGKDGQSNH